MRPKYQSHVSEDLQNAFEKVDETAEKLDALKKTYNETAKEITSIPSPALPAPPIVAPIPTPPAFRPGHYSVGTLDVPRDPSVVLRPKIPRPTPKPVPVLPPQIRRASGRFYIQVRDGQNTEQLRQVKEQLAQLGGRVVDSGHGTSANPDAGWIEVATPESVSQLIEKIRATGLTEVVEKIVEVDPGEGRLQARQLDLPGTHVRK